MTGAVTRQHSSVRRFRDLARTPPASGVDRELLLDGLHLLSEAHASGVAIETAAFEHGALDDPNTRKIAEQLSTSGTEVLIVSRNVLEAMSPVRTPTGSIGIARRALVSVSDVMRANRPLVVVAHDVQDPGNVGGMVRTAEAAGATGFVASAGTADPFGWKALRGSMGSALRLPLARAPIDEVLREARNAGLATVALVPRGGTPFHEIDLRRPTALLLGGEGLGLSRELADAADARISIPMSGRVESLNVGVAAGLVLYEAFRQRTT
ncbi:MAG: RNA methyltransferase [Vicinamibacterales bacterium]|nr:RNA methyltransferase [Vicinamibacterales bacterium]